MTTTVAKEKHVEGKVGTVVLAKTNKVALRGAVREVCGKDPAGMSTEQMVQALQTEFASYDQKSLIPCDTCGGLSDVELTSCPYCGEADEADAPVAAAPAAAVETKEAQVEKQTVASEKKSKKNGVHAKDLNPGLGESHKAEVVEEKGLSLLAGGTGIVKSDKDLDAAVAKVHKLQAETAASVWDIGKCVFEEVFSNKLWTHRVDSKGRQIYKSFNDFIKTELKLSHTFIYQAMEVAQAFTRAQCLEVGGSNLRLLVGAPKEDRESLLALVKEKGLTKNETKSLVQEVKKNKGVARQNNREGASKMPNSPGRTAQSIGLTLSTGKIKCGIHQRGNEEKKIRKSLGENKPVIRVVGLNGVVLTLQIVENAKGEWEAHGAAKREE